MNLEYDRPFLKIIITLCLSALLLSASAVARSQTPDLDNLKLADVSEFYDGALKLAGKAKEMPVRPVFSRSGLAGYVFLSADIAPIPAYSGHPVSVLIALDREGNINGARLYSHQEPIIVVGIQTQDLSNYIQQYTGLNSRDKVRVNAHGRPGYVAVDGITGATITVMVINRSIMKSVRQVSEYFSLGTDPVSGSSSRVSEVEDERLYWLQIWNERPVSTGLLVLALLLLLFILFFQDLLVVRTQLFERLRTGYLIFTVVFIGYYLGAQLSIMNVLIFINRIGANFSWEVLLIDPAIFLLWSFIAITILLWGRGVFCGWLCPFGALQDLLFRVGRYFKWLNWDFPPLVHERLWAIKYFILIGLVGLSLDSIVAVAPFVEVEPFKTTFSLKFQRQWGYVLYVVVLLLISVFNSKFYCKYLCPLGAALSLVGRFKIFEWLHRRNECGKPCQACASDCQINAIKSTGEIVDVECHYCLRCQVIYLDDNVCPPLVEKRKRQERRAEKRQRGKQEVIPAKILDDPETNTNA